MDKDHDWYPDRWKAMLIDASARTELAVSGIADLANDTGMKFTLADVIEKVARGLPPGHVAMMYLEEVEQAFRDFVRRCAVEILTGEDNE